MKISYYLLAIIIATSSCKQQTESTGALQSRIDSLEKKLAATYKPGFGEFMSSIQVHHAKLWFAGQNQNWELADFEMHEIDETIDAIKNFKPKEKNQRKLIC
jgi:hypothetical protein